MAEKRVKGDRFIFDLNPESDIPKIYLPLFIFSRTTHEKDNCQEVKNQEAVEFVRRRYFRRSRDSKRICLRHKGQVLQSYIKENARCLRRFSDEE